jgi:hypothetical protein
MKANYIIPEQVNRVTYLIEKVLEEEMNAEEELELNAWLAESEHNRLFFQNITNKETLKAKLKIYSGVNSESIWQQTLKKINAAKVLDLTDRKIFKIRRFSLAQWLGTLLANK